MKFEKASDGALGAVVSTFTSWLETVETSLGRVRVKVQGSGPSLRVRPENDDVVAIARTHGLPLDRVARTLTAEAEALLLGSDPEGG